MTSACTAMPGTHSKACEQSGKYIGLCGDIFVFVLPVYVPQVTQGQYSVGTGMLWS